MATRNELKKTPPILAGSFFARKGFTLLEIIVVLIIIGILAAVILPNLTVSMEQTKAQAAKNNLLAIAAAQEKYNEDYSPNYCTNAGAGPTCGATSASLFSALRLDFNTSDAFAYKCFTVGALYSCTAIDTQVTLTLTVSAEGAAVTCAGVTSNSYCPS